MLDDRDLAIIACLQDDARATYADVAARVGLSASSVHERVRKLETSGTIRGYRAIVDPEAIGLMVTALIAVTPLDPQQPDDLPERLADFPEVEDCLSVAGEANYVLKVRTRSTSDLEELIRRLRDKAGVATRTTIVLSIPTRAAPSHPEPGGALTTTILCRCGCSTPSRVGWTRSCPSNRATSRCMPAARRCIATPTWGTSEVSCSTI